MMRFQGERDTYFVGNLNLQPDVIVKKCTSYIYALNYVAGKGRERKHLIVITGKLQKRSS